MKYSLIELEKYAFVDELNKAAKKGAKPVWETYKQYIAGGVEMASVILEDPEGQTTLVKKKKK